MEGNGFTPDSYRVTASSENQNHPGISIMSESAPAPVCAPSTLGELWGVDVKKTKKRGRPRLNGQDGNSMTLSPMPISASVPLAGDYSSVAAWTQRDRPMMDSVKKKKHEFGNGGLGANFTPHILTVNAGEDVSKTIISFSQQGGGSRAICILAANGLISNVTLQQSNSSGGTLTHEGQFEILSLTGSFMPMDDGVTKSRSGGMSISLSASDGRILGGGLSGCLVAAGPVQVVIGSFSTDHQLDQQPKQNNHSTQNGTEESYYY